MSEVALAERIRHLETENARLRGLLETNGTPSTLRHQVRNALGLMRAIMRRSLDGKTSIEDFAAHVDGRFDALLRVQTALLSSPDGRIDLSSLVLGELLAQSIQEGDRATIKGSALRVEARQAELLGLVLHELATNAVKFGTLNKAAGHVDVIWEVISPDMLSLIWAETGARGGVPHPIFRGFGTEVIEAMLPYQLQAEGKLEFLSEGVRCTMRVPLKQG